MSNAQHTPGAFKYIASYEFSHAFAPAGCQVPIRLQGEYNTLGDALGCNCVNEEPDWFEQTHDDRWVYDPNTGERFTFHRVPSDMPRDQFLSHMVKRNEEVRAETKALMDILRDAVAKANAQVQA